ncbi:MAG: ribonuclease E inhibitor RraB [Rhizomicrobium sp.]
MTRSAGGGVVQKTHKDQIALNAHVLDALREHGDALAGVREIDHFAYFGTPQSRALFIDKCLIIGFKLRNTTEPYRPGAGFGAILSHSDVPDEEILGKVTSLLVDLAQECGGEYDGWETQVVS